MQLVFVLVVVLKSCEARTVRTFSLLTKTGESVLHAHFDRRRLAHRSIGRLALKFLVDEKQFEFELARSYPLFASGAIIKVTAGVSRTRQPIVDNHAPFKQFAFSNIQKSRNFCAAPKREMTMKKRDRQIFYHSQALEGMQPSRSSIALLSTA